MKVEKQLIPYKIDLVVWIVSTLYSLMSGIILVYLSIVSIPFDSIQINNLLLNLTQLILGIILIIFLPIVNLKNVISHQKINVDINA